MIRYHAVQWIDQVEFCTIIYITCMDWTEARVGAYEVLGLLSVLLMVVKEV